jgi:hypothetical protein
LHSPLLAAAGQSLLGHHPPPQRQPLLLLPRQHWQQWRLRRLPPLRQRGLLCCVLL